MIVCSCNALTKQQILDTLVTEPVGMQRSPAQAYRCLGCAPDCGRCLVTVRAILAEARVAACSVGCAGCPGHAAPQGHEEADSYFAIAAE